MSFAYGFTVCPKAVCVVKASKKDINRGENIQDLLKTDV